MVARANARQPADLLLRQTLSRRRGLGPEQATWISQAVFAYFRWLGWLDLDVVLERRFNTALALAERFRTDPSWPEPAELAARTVPEWVGSEVPAETGWHRSLQAEPALWLRCKPGVRDRLRTALGGPDQLVDGPLPDSARYLGTEDLFVRPEFQAGDFEIQDLASQAVSWMCAPQPGETWWDACAGEGGKTLHLSILMQGKGLIWASDRAGWRLDRLKQRSARAGCFNQRRVEWDGGKKPPVKTVFDGVLLDAPCAGLGTWGRNPHARWTTTPHDVQELAGIQRQLLTNVAGSVKPGGRLIYAVCTLTRSETEAVADAFSAAHPEFEPWPMTNPLAPTAPAAARWLLWPQDTGGNGMFVAAWRRREASPTA